MLPVWRTSMENLTKVSLVHLFVVRPHHFTVCWWKRWSHFLFRLYGYGTVHILKFTKWFPYHCDWDFIQQLYTVKIFTFHIGVNWVFVSYFVSSSSLVVLGYLWLHFCVTLMIHFQASPWSSKIWRLPHQSTKRRLKLTACGIMASG